MKAYVLFIILLGFAGCLSKNVDSENASLSRNDKFKAETALEGSESSELDLRKYFGKKYLKVSELKPLNYGGGGLLHDNKFKVRYGISFFHHKGFTVLFLEKLLDDPQYHAEILDGIAIKVADDEFVSIQLCQRRGVKDMEIIALSVLENEKEYYDQTKKAWRANRLKGKIEEISPNSIKCMNEGYGIQK